MHRGTDNPVANWLFVIFLYLLLVVTTVLDCIVVPVVDAVTRLFHSGRKKISRPA